MTTEQKQFYEIFLRTAEKELIKYEEAYEKAQAKYEKATREAFLQKSSLHKSAGEQVLAAYRKKETAKMILEAARDLLS